MKHKILHRLELTFGVSGIALSWLASYLSGREYFVRLIADSSEANQVLTGVLQGFVLGPFFFMMYTVDLIKLVRSLNLQPHLYVCDYQLHGSCRLEDTLTLTDRVTHCHWMRSNRLRLNSDKTEVI